MTDDGMGYVGTHVKWFQDFVYIFDIILVANAH